MLFISYSTIDQVLVDIIYDELKQASLDPWIASKDILSSENFAKKIAETIKVCDGIILILSSNASNSIHVEKELGLALKYKLPIFPIKIDGILPTESFEYYLEGVQWIDASSNFEKALEKYVGQIKNFFGDVSRQHQLAISTQNIIHEKKSKFKIVNKPDNIEKYLIEAIRIDEQFYAAEFVGVLDTCVNWYHANNEVYTFITDEEDKVVGCLNMMLVDVDVFEEIKNGQFIDNDIPSGSIIDPFMPGTYYLYFCSVTIDKNKKDSKREIFKLLYESFFQKLNKWADDGFYIQAMIADAITSDGRSIAESFGMQKITESHHESSIYSASLLPATFRVNDPLSKKLLGKYKEYYSEYLA